MKRFRTLMHRVCVASLTLVALRGGAQSIEPASGSVQPALNVPAQDHKAVTPELHLWRSLTLSQGITRHDYREPDPFGRVSPLSSETGSVPTTELTLRWRGQLAQALPELAMQARASYAQGQTDYNGYLQQGSTLTPYSARTGNTQQAISLRVGLPLNAFTEQPWAQHIAPYAEQGWHHWQRNLTQYGETFTWQTTALGVMALWPLADLGLPQFSSFTLEADVAAGRSHNPRMVAPTLGFATNLDETGKQRAVLALHYAVTSTWLLGLRYEAQRSNFGVSASTASLQYPGGGNRTQSLAASVEHQF